MPGKEAFQIAKDVANLAINNTELRRFFVQKGDFAFDEIGGPLTPNEHQLFAKYYALMFQASDQGMVCVNKQGDMCDDGGWGDWVHEDTYTVGKLTPVDLETLTKGTGWQTVN